MIPRVFSPDARRHSSLLTPQVTGSHKNLIFVPPQCTHTYTCLLDTDPLTKRNYALCIIHSATQLIGQFIRSWIRNQGAVTQCGKGRYLLAVGTNQDHVHALPRVPLAPTLFSSLWHQRASIAPLPPHPPTGFTAALNPHRTADVIQHCKFYVSTTSPKVTIHLQKSRSESGISLLYG